jgi:hypothetical protein
VAADAILAGATPCCERSCNLRPYSCRSYFRTSLKECLKLFARNKRRRRLQGFYEQFGVCLQLTSARIPPAASECQAHALRDLQAWCRAGRLDEYVDDRKPAAFHMADPIGGYAVQLSEEERLAVLHTAHPIERYTVQQSIEFRWEEVVNVSSSVLLLVLFCMHKGIGEEEDERHCRAVRGRAHRRVRCTAVRRVRWAEVEVCCQRKVDLDNEQCKGRKRNSKKAIRLGLGE